MERCAADDDAAADTGTHRDVERRIVALRGTPAVLGEGGPVDIGIHGYGHVQTGSDRGDDRRRRSSPASVSAACTRTVAIAGPTQSDQRWRCQWPSTPDRPARRHRAGNGVPGAGSPRVSSSGCARRRGGLMDRCPPHRQTSCRRLLPPHTVPSFTSHPARYHVWVPACLTPRPPLHTMWRGGVRRRRAVMRRALADP